MLILLSLQGVILLVVKSKSALSQEDTPSPYDRSCDPRYVDNSLSDESRLINCFLHRYRKVTTLARPLRDSGHTIRVEFGLSMVQILDFDETKQIITTSIWKNYVWRDEVLTWNPEDFGGMEHIRLPSENLWTPDIVLYNNADEQVKQHDELVAVYYNGTIKWIPPAIYRSSCEVEMENFPFDTQTCHFTFASWTFDEYKLDLQLFENRSVIGLEEYVRSSEWDILSTSATRIVRRYPFFAEDPYPELLFTFKIRRLPTFYVYLLVLPCVLLSCLTLVLFWIPPQRPDRTAVGMSLFSSFFILLLILVQSSPPTSASISRLGVYYCVNMVLIAVSTILSVGMINLGMHRTNTKMPAWLKKAKLDTLSKLLWVHYIPVARRGSRNQVECSYNGEVMMREVEVKDDVHNSSLARDIDDVTERWRVFAAILDRIFFLMYFVGILVAMAMLFPR